MIARFTPKAPAARFPSFEASPKLIGETPTERVYQLTGYMLLGPALEDRVKVSEGYEIRVPKRGADHE